MRFYCDSIAMVIAIITMLNIKIQKSAIYFCVLTERYRIDTQFYKGTPADLFIPMHISHDGVMLPFII